MYYKQKFSKSNLMVSDTEIRLQRPLPLGLSNYSYWYLLFFFSLLFPCLFSVMFMNESHNLTFLHSYVGGWIQSYRMVLFHMGDAVCQVGPLSSLMFLLPVSGQLPLLLPQCLYFKPLSFISSLLILHILPI